MTTQSQDAAPVAPNAAFPAPRRKPPSVGFVFVSLIYVATSIFFAWGISTPDLDRVWMVQHELKIGELDYPKKKDAAILEASMNRHEELARALLPEGEIGLLSANSEGWLDTPTATAIRTDRAKTFHEMRVNARTPPAHLPFTLRVKGKSWSEELEIGQPGEYSVRLPELDRPSELIKIEMKGKGLTDDPSVLGVHIAFCCDERGHEIP